MMKVDYKTLTIIRDFFENKLSETKADEVEKLIKSDEIFASHARFYETTEKGIEKAIKEPQKTWMRELDHTKLSAENSSILQTLKKNDRKNTFYRRLFLLSSLLFLLIILIYFFWTKSENSSLNNNIENIPIAAQKTDDGEILMGSTGKDIKKEIQVLVFSFNTHSLKNTGKNQQLIIRKTEESDLSYLFKEGLLTVFTANPKLVSEADLRWLKKETNGEMFDYLLIDKRLFIIDKTSQKRALFKEIVDPKILDMIE